MTEGFRLRILFTRQYCGPGITGECLPKSFMAGPGADDPQVVTANFPCQLKEVITLPGNARVDCMVPQCGIICQAFFHLVIKNVDNVYFIVQVSGHSPVIAAEIPGNIEK